MLITLLNLLEGSSGTVNATGAATIRPAIAAGTAERQIDASGAATIAAAVAAGGVGADTGQSGVSRLRRSRKSWADTHLYEVVPKEDAAQVEIAPKPVAIPTPAPLPVEAVAAIVDEFDFIEIDNDFMRLIAELGEREFEVGKAHRRVA